MHTCLMTFWHEVTVLYYLTRFFPNARRKMEHIERKVKDHPQKEKERNKRDKKII